MNCSPFDLRDYTLKELSATHRQQVDAHVKSCGACREEVERLRITEAALFALREEEIPQRIAFVSDKIFEPSPWRRAWTAFWGSTARLGFASAAMLSTALVVFSLARTAGAPAGPVSARVPAVVSDAAIEERIQAAVDRAETRLQQTFDQRAAEMEKRNQQVLTRLADDFALAQRQQLAIVRSDYTLPRVNGEFK